MKYSKEITRLNVIEESLNAKIEHLEDCQAILEEKALDHDRDMTEKEEEKYDAYAEQIEELEDIICEIQSLEERLEELQQ